VHGGLPPWILSVTCVQPVRPGFPPGAARRSVDWDGHRLFWPSPLGAVRGSVDGPVPDQNTCLRRAGGCSKRSTEMQSLWAAEAFGGDHLLAVESGRWHQAGVDRRPPAAAIGIGPIDQHRARTALALGAAFLASGQAGSAQPFEQRDVTTHVSELAGPAVDGQPTFHLPLPSTSVDPPCKRLDRRPSHSTAMGSDAMPATRQVGRCYPSQARSTRISEFTFRHTESVVSCKIARLIAEEC
jgi:hypothetical protein